MFAFLPIIVGVKANTPGCVKNSYLKLGTEVYLKLGTTSYLKLGTESYLKLGTELYLKLGSIRTHPEDGFGFIPITRNK